MRNISSFIIRVIILHVVFVNISYGQNHINISYQGFINNSYTFFIKNVSEDTISIINPSFLFDYSNKMKCFEVDKNNFTYESNLVSINYPYIENKLKDFVADGREDEFYFSSNVYFILPGESFGLRLRPVKLKRNNLRVSYVKLKLQYKYKGLIQAKIYPW